MRSFFFLTLSVAVLFTACKQDAEVYNPDFKGEWVTDTMIETNSGAEINNYLRIDGDNSAYGFACEVTCTQCGCMMLNTGKAKINRKHTRLWVGDMNNTSPLKIDQEPYLDVDGVWKMKIEGILYYKQ